MKKVKADLGYAFSKFLVSLPHRVWRMGVGFVKVLVATVGTTSDPIIESIEKNDVDLIYLVYGRSFPGQHPSPLDVAKVVRDRARELRRNTMEREVPDPEDVKSCVDVFKEIIKDLAGKDVSEVIVNFTGGTKTMSAAAFHVFASKAPSKVVFEYVGGVVRDEAGRVKGNMVIRRDYRTAVEELADEVVKHLEGYEFFLAFKISEGLPDTYNYRFLKSASKAFWLWDSFEYEEAMKVINEIGDGAEAFVSQQVFGKVPENVVRLRRIGNRLVRAMRGLRKCQGEGAKFREGDGHLVPLEFLANAERRLKMGEYAEAVLRAYRAVEAAVQLRLLENNVNPWSVNWQQIPDHQEILKQLGYSESPPEHLTLWNGLQLLSLISPIRQLEEVKDNLQFISNLRNNSKLEHGYAGVDEENAEKSIKKAMEIMRVLLGDERAQEIEKVRIFA